VNAIEHLPEVSLAVSGGAPEPRHSIARLIRRAQETKIPWIIEGIWQEGGIVIVHSLEEEFKSIFTYQMGDAIAAGTSLLRSWKVPKTRRVGIFETEMDDLEVGNRLMKMYPQGGQGFHPEHLIVSDGELIKEFRRRPTLDGKFECLEKWIRSNDIDILMWDTINSILAAGDPNSEVGVSKFFDRLNLLPLKGSLLVRHDGKPSKDSANRHSNQRVRGSNRIVEDASVVIHLHRQDKAKNKVSLAVGKLRNAPKPQPRELWFDSGIFQLTPLNPVAALLERRSLTRGELISEGEKRFGLKERSIDTIISELRPLLIESRQGHKLAFSIDLSAVPELGSLPETWWHLLIGVPAPSREMQGCISMEGR
jgi:hypothetical protein